MVASLVGPRSLPVARGRHAFRTLSNVSPARRYKFVASKPGKVHFLAIRRGVAMLGRARDAMEQFRHTPPGTEWSGRWRPGGQLSSQSPSHS